MTLEPPSDLKLRYDRESRSRRISRPCLGFLGSERWRFAVHCSVLLDVTSFILYSAVLERLDLGQQFLYEA